MEQLVCRVRRHCRHFAREVRVDTAPIAALPQAPRVRTQRCLRQRSAWGRLNAPFPWPAQTRATKCRQSVATAFGGKNINAQVGVHLFGEANRWHL